MKLEVHSEYQRLREKSRHSHRHGRSAEGITPEEIARARLYSYAFRMHTIGAYHATRVAIEERPKASEPAMLHRRRAVETLRDLADQAMDPVPRDFRALLSTFHRYDTRVGRVLEALVADADASGDEQIGRIGGRFSEIIGEITNSNGIHVTRDTGAPGQASFVVPNLGITIVPLVYGDHHSWNLAYLESETGTPRDVPVHRHHQGVEIHLGYEPIEGFTILGDCGAEVTEGYAMPIPPMIAHGFTNTSGTPHHVPFIFGSLQQAGWGVFLDVEAQPCEMEKLRRVPMGSDAMNGTVHLVREIDAAVQRRISHRATLIPASRTDRDGSGGLELSVARIDEQGLEITPSDHFRIVSVVRGAGTVDLEGIPREIGAHDHFGIPARMRASLRGQSEDPMITLDAVIKQG